MQQNELSNEEGTARDGRPGRNDCQRAACSGNQSNRSQQLSIEVMIRDFKIVHRDYHRAQRAGSRSAALLNRIMAARIAERLMRAGLSSADIARMELEAEAEAENG